MEEIITIRPKYDIIISPKYFCGTKKQRKTDFIILLFFAILMYGMFAILMPILFYTSVGGVLILFIFSFVILCPFVFLVLNEYFKKKEIENTYYTIFPDKLIIQRGINEKAKQEIIDMQDIKDVRLIQIYEQRIRNTGTIEFTLKNYNNNIISYLRYATQNKFYFNNIENPQEIYDEILRRLPSNGNDTNNIQNDNVSNNFVKNSDLIMTLKSNYIPFSIFRIKIRKKLSYRLMLISSIFLLLAVLYSFVKAVLLLMDARSFMFIIAIIIVIFDVICFIIGATKKSKIATYKIYSDKIEYEYDSLTNYHRTLKISDIKDMEIVKANLETNDIGTIYFDLKNTDVFTNSLYTLINIDNPMLVYSKIKQLMNEN